jgi:3'-5' exoribonuclease
MSRRFINQLGEREPIDEIFVVTEKQLRPNRAGNLYMSMQLSDRTGAVNGMMWNANNEVYQGFDNGDYVQVEGRTQYHNGALQIIVTDIGPAEPGSIDESDFVQLTPKDVGTLRGRLAEILRSINDFHLRNLAECCLIDEPLMAKMETAPAGVKNHHAYQGGLLEHVVNVMELVEVVAPRYRDEIDRDLLLMGAFLHDIGKVDELTYPRDVGYSDEGQLLGHVIIAIEMLNEKIAEAERLANEKVPAETVLRLKHMIVAHHGQYEFGSPKLPMTCEAVALHHLDDLDAKIHSFAKLVQEDVNTDSNWTTYFPNLGRKLFKGQ